VTPSKFKPNLFNALNYIPYTWQAIIPKAPLWPTYMPSI